MSRLTASLYASMPVFAIRRPFLPTAVPVGHTVSDGVRRKATCNPLFNEQHLDDGIGVRQTSSKFRIGRKTERSPMARLGVTAAIACMASAVYAEPPIKFTSPITLSDQPQMIGMAYKSKMVRLGNGTLLVAYGNAIEDTPSSYVYDLKGDIERPARDIFVRTCDSANDDCSDPTHWTPAINISNTAAISSISTDWTGSTDELSGRTPYHGDSGKPNIFSAGSHVAITWVDKYCPWGSQRTVTYLERDSREIPFSCVYAAHATGSFNQNSDWTVNTLSDASLDAKEDVNRGLSNGNWVITWQADPLGLQLGGAEGPGEGASGAKVSGGTDVWYTYTTNLATAMGAIGVWQTPIRLTDNNTGTGVPGAFNPVKDAEGDPVDPDVIDRGATGASRANSALVGGSSPPTAVVAYEETKGAGGLEEGKYLRYHHFPFSSPPSDPVGQAGCIISDPFEIARRARFVTQTNPGPGIGLRWAILWRQGTFDQGGPADIVLRQGFTDFAVANLHPGVDPACETSDFDTAIALDNSPAINVSSNTLMAGDKDLADSTGANNLENARAHRALLRGDDLYVGYSYTPDWAVAEFTDLENYNFFLRHLDSATGSWTAAKNLSKINKTDINVTEPRLVGTPGSGPGCTDPSNPVNPEDCRDTSTFFAAWGTQTNVYQHIGGSVDLDLYATYTTDKGRKFAKAKPLAKGPNAQRESQLRATPDGSRVFAVWNEKDANGVSDSRFTVGTTQKGVAPGQR